MSEQRRQKGNRKLEAHWIQERPSLVRGDCCCEWSQDVGLMCPDLLTSCIISQYSCLLPHLNAVGRNKYALGIPSLLMLSISETEDNSQAAAICPKVIQMVGV